MIREVLWLKLKCSLSDRQIAQTARIARSTIGEDLRRFRKAAMADDLPAGLRVRMTVPT
jgi:hypothetical protein